MSTRTALYLRCSSPDQIRTGFSIPDQLARLRNEARTAGEQIVEEFIDQARSGTSAKQREAYQRLLAAARRREFDRVRVESVDRGHRNDTERRLFEEELGRLGIAVVYSGEPEKQAPQYRKLQRAVKGALAEWESDETSQRTYKRHLYRAKQGKWRGGNPPYGLKPDATGWFEPDKDTFDVLLWIVERRAEGLTYHAIAKLLNGGIVLGDADPVVPPTPGLVTYQRKPYLERQDPETGDVIHVPRRIPSAMWIATTVREICQKTVDGVYAGVLHWGENANRFQEDADGNQKQVVHIETGRALIPSELLRRVQAVELAVRAGELTAMSPFNTFLLSHGLRCGICGRSMSGYTNRKTKGGRQYEYRKYRCSGRSNRPGSCKMPMMSADMIEQAVLEAVLTDVQQGSTEPLLEAINAAMERRRAELLQAISIAEVQRDEQAQRRAAALEALTFQYRDVSARIRAALAEQAEAVITAHDELEAQIRTMRLGLDVLDEKARTIEVTLNDPLLDPARWNEAQAHWALKRALNLLVHSMTLRPHTPGVYEVEVEIYEIRESGVFESAWKSNPPARFVTTPSGFEDQDSHRATSALDVILLRMSRIVNCAV